MTVVEIYNLALLKIGVSETISATSDASREAWTGALEYDHLLRYALRRFSWPSATRYTDDDNNPFNLVRGTFWDTDPTTMTKVQAWSSTANYVVGDVVRYNSINYYCVLASLNNQPPDTTYWSTDSADAPAWAANGDWLYAYRWPSDCLFARRLVDDAVDRQFGPDPFTFRIGRDVNGLLIYTNQADAILEYTAIDCAHLWTDDIFIEALAWLLASAAAPSLSRNGLTAEQCRQFFEREIDIAAVVASRESQQEHPGDAEWHRLRN